MSCPAERVVAFSNNGPASLERSTERSILVQRHRDPRIDDHTKAKYRDFLKRKLPDLNLAERRVPPKSWPRPRGPGATAGQAVAEPHEGRGMASKGAVLLARPGPALRYSDPALDWSRGPLVAAYFAATNAVMVMVDGALVRDDYPREMWCSHSVSGRPRRPSARGMELPA